MRLLMLNVQIVFHVGVKWYRPKYPFCVEYDCFHRHTNLPTSIWTVQTAAEQVVASKHPR